MSDPTAAEALSDALTRWAGTGDYGPDFDDATWDKAIDDACDALGIDPDSPLSLLHWHATQQERERCAERVRWIELVPTWNLSDDFIAGYSAAVANAVDAIRRSDRL